MLKLLVKLNIKIKKDNEMKEFILKLRNEFWNMINFLPLRIYSCDRYRELNRNEKTNLIIWFIYERERKRMIISVCILKVKYREKAKKTKIKRIIGGFRA